jgi:hypothetical protein
LPSSEEFRNIGKCITLLEAILCGRRCHAAGKTMHGQIEGILTIVKGLSKEIPPDEALQHNKSPFYTQCMQRLVNFAHTQIEPQALENGKLVFSARKNVHGIKALEWVYDACKVLSAEGNLQSLERISVLKTYYWALSKEAAEAVDAWTNMLLQKKMTHLKSLTLPPPELVPIDEKTDKAKKGKTAKSASSSAASSSVVAIMAHVAPVDDATSVAAMKKADLNEKLLKLFG